MLDSAPGSLAYPSGDGFRSDRGEGFFELAVFGDGAGDGGLKHMVQAGQFLQRAIVVSAGLERLLNSA